MKFATPSGMAGTSRIPDELAAEMTPAVRAFVETLFKRIDDLESRLGKTPPSPSPPFLTWP